MPRVSILVTNYNNGPWIRACIDSALAQTRPADEIIVFDDGSTDDSLAILRAYRPRIRLIEGGPRTERPLGIVCQAEGVARAFAASHGDFIFMLDGDDCYLPRRVELALRTWETRPATALVQGPHLEIDEQGRQLRELRLPRPPGDRYLEAILRSNRVDWFYATSMQSFRRDFLSSHLPLDMPRRLDVAMDMRLAYLAALSPGGVAAHDEIATLYRCRASSMNAITGLMALSRLDFTRMQVACFNAYAHAAGRPQVVRWKDPRFPLQWARHHLPRGLGTWLATRKAASASARRKHPETTEEAR